MAQNAHILVSLVNSNVLNQNCAYVAFYPARTVAPIVLLKECFRIVQHQIQDCPPNSFQYLGLKLFSFSPPSLPQSILIFHCLSQTCLLKMARESVFLLLTLALLLLHPAQATKTGDFYLQLKLHAIQHIFKPWLKQICISQICIL